MPTDHNEPAPLNDTADAKGLAEDPQLAEVERREEAARTQGQSQDEAQARAWAEVNQGSSTGPSVDKPAVPHKDGNSEQGDISVGG